MSAIVLRDRFAVLSGNKTVVRFESGGIQIVSDDGRTLFDIDLDGASLRIQSGDYCKHGGRIWEDRFVIVPMASNVVRLQKVPDPEKGRGK